MKFSVLISVYDKEVPSNLRSSLESVFEQSIPPAEVVLVVDGPVNEGLANVCKDFHDRYKELKILTMDKNQGLGVALETGLLRCSNEIVARMDTDDICKPDRFEKQIDFFRNNPDYSVVGTAVEEFDKAPGDLQRFRALPTSCVEIKRFSKFRNPLNHPTVMFKRSAVLEVGSYKHMPLFEDYFLWVRLLSRGFKIGNLEDSLVYFRVGNDMVGRRHGLGYCLKELRFLTKCFTLEHITLVELLTCLIVKVPLRLMPKAILSRFYKSFLR